MSTRRIRHYLLPWSLWFLDSHPIKTSNSQSFNMTSSNHARRDPHLVVIFLTLSNTIWALLMSILLLWTLPLWYLLIILFPFVIHHPIPLYPLHLEVSTVQLSGFLQNLLIVSIPYAKNNLNSILPEIIRNNNNNNSKIIKKNRSRIKL